MLPQVPILNQDIKPIAIVTKKEEPKGDRLYTIKEGDTLTSIAETQGSSVSRLWSKNTDLADPNLIEPDKPLEIPQKDEALADRPMPVIVEVQHFAQETSQQSNLPRSSGAGLSSSGLVGSIGYAIHTGNCVNTARAHGKIQPGNPISWVPNTQTPFIGAAALFHYNHVGIVVGIWPNGDLEIIHENYRGSEHRFPRSEFRGFF